MSKSPVVLLSLFLMINHVGTTSSAAASDAPSIAGYYKTFFTVFDTPGEQLPEDAGTSLKGVMTQRLRMNTSYAPREWISFDVAYDFSLQIQDLNLAALGVDTESRTAYRGIDLGRQLYPEETAWSFGVLQNLDRARVTLSVLEIDISLGRQPLAWGSARVLNPTDILAPFTFDALDTEDRPGVDAVRLRIPLGMMSELDAGGVFGDDFDLSESALFLRAKGYALETDLALLLIDFRENLMVGCDLTRYIGGAASWLEAAYVLPNAFANDAQEENSYLNLSLGADFSLWGTTYLFLEYHYNGAGVGDAAHYFENLDRTAYSEGSVYLMGRHYLIPGISWQITPLLTLNSTALCNLNDPSVLISLSSEYNIAEDIYLAAGAFIGIGRSASIDGDSPQPRSEFGVTSDIYYSSFRIYF